MASSREKTVVALFAQKCGGWPAATKTKRVSRLHCRTISVNITVSLPPSYFKKNSAEFASILSIVVYYTEYLLEVCPYCNRTRPGAYSGHTDFFFFFFLSTRSQWGGKMVRGVENGGDFFSPFAVVISTPLKAQSSHSERALNVRLTSLTPLLLCVCVRFYVPPNGWNRTRTQNPNQPPDSLASLDSLARRTMRGEPGRYIFPSYSLSL